MEDVTAVSGGATTATRYYSLPGGVTATRDSSGLVYEATDALGTPIASLNLSTGIVGEQLRAPYGQARYAANGTGSGGGMRTPYGFTGQREDTTPTGSSGLDDFNARMYDAATGRFTSADDAQPGLGDPSGMDGYAYVGGMVEQATDPSGHVVALRLENQVGDLLLIAGAVVGTMIVVAFADWLHAHLNDPAVNRGILTSSAASAAAATGAGATASASAITVTQGNNTSITLAPDGRIDVTAGTSTATYWPGQPGYAYYMHAFDVPVSAGDLPLNQATDRPLSTSTSTTSTVGSGSSSVAAGTSPAPVGMPPSTVQPGVAGAAAGALAPTVATAGALAGTWYAFAKKNTDANKMVRRIARENGLNPNDPDHKRKYDQWRRYVEEAKRAFGGGGAWTGSWEYLRELAEEFGEFYGWEP